MNDTMHKIRLLDSLRNKGLHLAVSFAEEPDRPESVPMKELLQPERLRAAVEHVAERMKSGNLAAAASLFQKRYSGILLGSVLGPLSAAGVGLFAAAEETEVVLTDGLPTAVVLHSRRNPLVLTERLPEEFRPFAERWQYVDTADHLRQPVLQSVFDHNIGPLIYSLAMEIGLSPRVMWGNVGNFVGYLYSHLGEQPDHRENAVLDKAALLDSVGFDAPPLGQTYQEVWLEEAQPAQWIRVRSTCCMWNKFPGNKSCYTCPLICNKERAELLTSYGS